MSQLRTFIRSTSYVLSSVLIAIGTFSFVHGSLVVLRVITPVGDGPFGIIDGPIFIVIGAVWFAFLRSTRSVLD